jgi:hypothetical protein
MLAYIDDLPGLGDSFLIRDSPLFLKRCDMQPMPRIVRTAAFLTDDRKQTQDIDLLCHFFRGVKNSKISWLTSAGRS